MFFYLWAPPLLFRRLPSQSNCLFSFSLVSFQLSFKGSVEIGRPSRAFPLYQPCLRLSSHTAVALNIFFPSPIHTCFNLFHFYKSLRCYSNVNSNLPFSFPFSAIFYISYLLIFFNPHNLIISQSLMYNYQKSVLFLFLYL